MMTTWIIQALTIKIKVYVFEPGGCSPVLVLSAYLVAVMMDRASPVFFNKT